MIGTTVGVGIALRRCLMRALVTKRYVAPHFVKRQHRDFARHWPHYCALLDHCWLYLASHGTVQLLAESTAAADRSIVAAGSSPASPLHANLTVHLPDAYDAFLATRYFGFVCVSVCMSVCLCQHVCILSIVTQSQL
jgi:hypothetical protein